MDTRWHGGRRARSSNATEVILGEYPGNPESRNRFSQEVGWIQESMAGEGSGKALVPGGASDGHESEVTNPEMGGLARASNGCEMAPHEECEALLASTNAMKARVSAHDT